MHEQLALAAIFLVSAFTMTFAGFGFALISVPLLALLFPVQTAVALQCPYCMLLFVYQAWHYRKHFCWQDMRPMFWGSVAGLTLGSYLLYQLPEVALKRSLALFIVAVVAFNWSKWSKGSAAGWVHSPWWGRVCGFLSGSLLGAYTIGGPPAVVYIASRNYDPMRAKSFMASFFSAQFVFVMSIYAYTGLFTAESLKTSALYSPVVVLGSLAGFWIFNKASNHTYRVVVQIMLLAAAVALWWRA
jgi:uncharacterized membrane protein YfcA